MQDNSGYPSGSSKFKTFGRNTSDKNTPNTQRANFVAGQSVVTNNVVANITNNPTLEKQVLALIFENQRNAYNLIPYLEEDDFFTAEYQLLFNIFKALFDTNQLINTISVLEFAKKYGYNKVDLSLLNSLVVSNTFEGNITYYLQELERLTILRKMQAGLVSVLNQIQGNPAAEPAKLQDELNNLMYDLGRRNFGADFATAKKVSDEYFANLEKRHNATAEITGVPTGYRKYDALNQGMQPNELIILAARPGMGKTAFALNIALNVAKLKFQENDPNKHHNVAFFSLEMSPEQLMGRIYSILTGINGNKLKEAKHLTDQEMMYIYTKKTKEIDKLNLFIDDSGTNTINEIIWKCRRLHKLHPLDLIVVDYLQLINVERWSNGENRQNEITRISRALKLLAKDLHIPVIALSQLSREVERREDKRPLLADLRESGAIEQDADVVMFLYRDSYYERPKNNPQENPTNLSEAEQEARDITVVNLIVAKNRNGSRDDIPLLFNLAQGRFLDMDLQKLADQISGRVRPEEVYL
ncbi:replicative DNA helicase [Mycoplasmopsis columbinasalis]|uniref:Replicative DNA helicase n=1 Tax=Mycoplasmopsis columbinasalis TaxID=114880 RepID=A0A449BA57_9BACT|nr:replicative DNA helicase [Mycoplasmopsis columbinasalis]VEU78083.1 Replicative DNA helicase [Mycoplasmopsis columbinasalis]